MFSKNNVSKSMIDAVDSVLSEGKKLLLEPEDEKKDRKKNDEVKEALKGNQVKLDKNHNGKLDAQDFKLLRMKKESILDSMKFESRISQRHPLEGHEYHKKSNAELIHIAKDAHAAAEAMKSHDTAAENKYRDQANDSATVRYFRQKNGMPDWYKKKYGHIKEGQDVVENTGVTDYNPKSQGGTRKELLAKYHTTKSPKDAEAARKAGATQKELQDVVEGNNNWGGPLYDPDLQKGKKKPKLSNVKVKFPPKQQAKKDAAKLPKQDVKTEDVELDEANTETKKEFQARQERLAAAHAETQKDPKRLARLMKIPGYADAMALAKKTTQKEEVEQLDELSPALLDRSAKLAAEKGKDARAKGHDEAGDEHMGQAVRLRIGYHNAVERDRKKASMSSMSPAKQRKYAISQKRAMDDEDELDERTLTSGEKSEKERLVKSMKKGFKGFRERYGNRAKNVMYATATKRAMGEDVETDICPECLQDPCVCGGNHTSVKEDIGAMQSVVGENKGKKAIRVDTLKGITTSNDPEVKNANAHFSGKSATLKSEGKGTETNVPFVTDSVSPTQREINKVVKPTFKKIKEMLGKTGTSE